MLRLLTGAMAVLAANREQGVGEQNWEVYNEACVAALAMITEICESLARQSSGLVQDDVLDVAASVCELRSFETDYWPAGALLNLIAVHWGKLGLDAEGERAISQIRERVARDAVLQIRSTVAVSTATSDVRSRCRLLPGDRFADAILELVQKQPGDNAEAWKMLLTYAATADGARPATKWQVLAERVLDGVGGGRVRQIMAGSLPLFGKPRESYGVQSHAGRDSSVRRR